MRSGIGGWGERDIAAAGAAGAALNILCTDYSIKFDKLKIYVEKFVLPCQIHERHILHVLIFAVNT